jgi:ribosomal protein L16 Arg81 hydroxylase
VPVVTSHFLDNLTLASLIAPVSEEEFRTRYWERESFVVHRNDSGYYGDLFTLKDFDDAVARSPAYIRTANAAAYKKTKTIEPGRALDVEAVLAEMRGGGTLILDQMHNHHPKLAQLCRALGPELGHRFQTNLYLTPPNGRGFTPHWDNHDVFILQVVGSKHWQVDKVRRVFPRKGEACGDDEREFRGEVVSFTLKQGDIAYIPRGFVHAAECGPEPSLHITFGVTAAFLEDVLLATIRAAVQRDERLRAALPLGFNRASGEALVKNAMAVLHEISDEKFLSAVVDEYMDQNVRTFPLDISGQISGFFQPPELKLDDVIGPRRGIVYRIHTSGDSVRLNFGARSITFPDFFGEAVDFALKTRSFAIRDIPGEIEDQERIVFVERLVEEGLIVLQPS